MLRVDLSTESFTEIEHLLNHLNLILSEWEDVYGRNENERGLGSRFSGVIRRAYRQTGRRVVILIDEYDKPLLENMHDDALNERMRRELRAFYSVLKASDDFIRFSMLTGV